jgi:hypothetical protein
VSGRPERHESRRRGERFKELVAQGIRPDVAARAAGVRAERALRMLGEAIGLVATEVPTPAAAGTPTPAGRGDARGPACWAHSNAETSPTRAHTRARDYDQPSEEAADGTLE